MEITQHIKLLFQNKSLFNRNIQTEMSFSMAWSINATEKIENRILSEPTAHVRSITGIH